MQMPPSLFVPATGRDDLPREHLLMLFGLVKTAKRRVKV